jgi:nucleotide-binding universal stress UspA family protein
MTMRSILLATDGSKSAQKALELATDLARVNNARLLILNVKRPENAGSLPPELAEFALVENVRLTERDLYSEVASRIVRDAEKTARELGAQDVEAFTAEGDPARCIVDAANSRNVDAIVIGSHGLGDFESLLLGSVSHKVAHLAPCTCIIVR